MLRLLKREMICWMVVALSLDGESRLIAEFGHCAGGGVVGIGNKESPKEKNR